jgi:hypothetical protein
MLKFVKPQGCTCRGTRRRHRSSVGSSPACRRACKIYGTRCAFLSLTCVFKLNMCFGKSATFARRCVIRICSFFCFKKNLQSMKAPQGLKRNLQTSIIQAAVLNVAGKWQPASEDIWAGNSKDRTQPHLSICASVLSKRCRTQQHVNMRFRVGFSLPEATGPARSEPQLPGDLQIVHREVR